MNTLTSIQMGSMSRLSLLLISAGFLFTAASGQAVSMLEEAGEEGDNEEAFRRLRSGPVHCDEVY